MTPVRLQITSIGDQGDGIASLDGRSIFVPYTLPGETVEAEVVGERATEVRRIQDSPDRRLPACSRFGECGGCTLQHLPESGYLAFKHRLVADALQAQGLDARVEPVVPCAQRTRRRAVFAAAATPQGVRVGFNERRSGRIIDLPDCAVLAPELHAAIGPLEALVADIAPSQGHLDIAVTVTAGGLDAAITNAPRDLSADRRMALAGSAAARAFARVAINGEVVVQHRTPAIRAGSAWLTPPPGGFLQAVESAEIHMVERVKAIVGSARRVVDLFSGSGTFSLPLAATATVHAVESFGPALDALARAAQTPGLKPVSVEKRDLFRRPLTAMELARFDAVVLDPPRAGAEAQCAQIAASKVRTVAMVSCNAATFARDAARLCAAGFRLKKVTPVDQFLWSPHIEVVASFTR